MLELIKSSEGCWRLSNPHQHLFNCKSLSAGERLGGCAAEEGARVISKGKMIKMQCGGGSDCTHSELQPLVSKLEKMNWNSFHCFQTVSH